MRNEWSSLCAVEAQPLSLCLENVRSVSCKAVLHAPRFSTLTIPALQLSPPYNCIVDQKFCFNLEHHFFKIHICDSLFPLLIHEFFINWFISLPYWVCGGQKQRNLFVLFNFVLICILFDKQLFIVVGQIIVFSLLSFIKN